MKGNYLVFDIETTGLNPLEHKTILISVMFRDWKTPSTLLGDEKEILQRFWNLVKIADYLVGFNVYFDWRFLVIRSLAHHLPIIKKPIIDLREVLNNGQGKYKGRLKEFAELAGLEVKDVINGAQVPQLYEEGNIEAIKSHCESDVLLTKQLHDIMERLGILD